MKRLNKEGLRIRPCLTPLRTDKVFERDIFHSDNYFQVTVPYIQHSKKTFRKVNFHKETHEFVVIHCIKCFTDIKWSNINWTTMTSKIVQTLFKPKLKVITYKVISKEIKYKHFKNFGDNRYIFQNLLFKFASENNTIFCL